MHDQLLDENRRRQLLGGEELRVYETFARPFEPFEVDESVIGELSFRAEYDSLEEDENELLERHYEWQEGQSLERLPACRRSSYQFILRAMRYETLVRLGAPEIVCTEEARCLAKEMVLFYAERKD
jgi:hypothetical protein